MGEVILCKLFANDALFRVKGVSMLGISDAAEYIGFRTIGVRISFDQLIKETNLPCILHWNQNHFIVCYRIECHKNGEVDLYIADPTSRKLIYHKEEFLKCWISKKENKKHNPTAIHHYFCRMLFINSIQAFKT